MSRRRKTGPRWSAEKRYEFIEFRLYWTGRLNRADLMDAFSLSSQQASKDINEYLEGRKSNLIYDRQARCYRRGKNFRPRFYEPDASGFLTQLWAVEDGLVSEDQSWLGALPEYAGTPVPARGVDPEIIREVYSALIDKKALAITYQSLSRPDPSERVIEPHALAFDGFRWHTRAFCLSDKYFKDFLLSRILGIRGSRESEASADNDSDWHSDVTLEIAPHPELSETQAKVIALDYGMRGGKAKIKVRRALLYYALRRLGLDTNPAARRPQDQQIVLLNRDQISQTAQGIMQ
jgi:hypothetical protein